LPPKIPTSPQDEPAKDSGTTTSAPIDASLTDGPKIGPNGEYQPARYRTSRGNIRQDN